MGKRLIIPGADFSANAIDIEPIIVPVEFTLQNGYASIAAPANTNIDINTSSTANAIRVRTDQLYGSYTVKTKPGYVIRSIACYDNLLQSTAPGNYAVTNGSTQASAQGLTSYDLNNDGRYSIITFCKTNANEAISASEDIVDYIVRP